MDVTVNVISLVPPDMPVITPVVEPTVAMPVLLLVHVPPPVASLSNVVRLTHTTSIPCIADGSGFTVTVVVE